MVQRTISLILTLIASALLITMAVTNKHSVPLRLNPFNPEDASLTLPVPLFALLFALLIAGVILGGVASWLSQGKWRRTARHRTQEALRWKAEADRLMRERDATVERRKQLTSA